MKSFYNSNKIEKNMLENSNMVPTDSGLSYSMSAVLADPQITDEPAYCS